MALATKSTISWHSFFDDVTEYLENEAPDLWRKIFRPLIQGVIVDQGKRWAAVLGMTFDVQPLFAREWYAKYIAHMPIPIIDTTKAEVGKLIDAALAEGWSIPNMQNAIEDLFSIMQPYRSERIARTETIRASNAGTTELFTEWGVQQHEWISTKDDRTRGNDPKDEYDHLGSWPSGPDGEVVRVGEPFMGTGEALLYPGDPAGSPGNTINCRCSTLPVVEGME